MYLKTVTLLKAWTNWLRRGHTRPFAQYIEHIDSRDPTKDGCIKDFIKRKFLVHIFQQAFLKTSILETSEALHIVRIANITKPFRILYQISKLFLNFNVVVE